MRRSGLSHSQCETLEHFQAITMMLQDEEAIKSLENAKWDLSMALERVEIPKDEKEAELNTTQSPGPSNANRKGEKTEGVDTPKDEEAELKTAQSPGPSNADREENKTDESLTEEERQRKAEEERELIEWERRLRELKRAREERQERARLRDEAKKAREERERQERERLRKEQQEAYEQSLAREKQRKAEEEKEKLKMEKREEEEEEAAEERRIEEKERRKAELLASLPVEPSAEVDTVEVRIRVPGSAPKTRRFHASDKLKMLLLYVESEGFFLDEYRLWNSDRPKKNLADFDAEKTFEELNWPRRELIHVGEK
ncbi:hypothetical protein L596_022359 [Steinernema carpocapsae]|uniref:UBX domain-containing protein n=1 Tax=Steinernema carpocapsae TaxID=34508 RepID=A0A4U5MLI6_STECR|nr:hypothetical protein L596_022359 [Steinernema carpocapsae]